MQSLTEQLSASQQNHLGAVESAVQEKQAEIEAQQQKNNELREKNYKIMEALSAAEKSLVELKKSTASAASRSSLQQEFVTALQRVFPELVCDSASESFADQIVSQLSSAVSTYAPNPGCLAHFSCFVNNWFIFLQIRSGCLKRSNQRPIAKCFTTKLCWHRRKNYSIACRVVSKTKRVFGEVKLGNSKRTQLPSDRKEISGCNSVRNSKRNKRSRMSISLQPRPSISTCWKPE